MSNIQLDNSTISRHLGKSSEYKSTYDPNLLVRELRSNNRQHLNIEEGNLPFLGFDVWNGYEISALQHNGLPVTFVAKVVYSSDSKYIVESKSMKLYWNSFNMEKLGSYKGTVKSNIQLTAAKDLSNLLETDVRVELFDCDNYEYNNDTIINNRDEYITIEKQLYNNAVEFDSYKEDENLLREDKISLKDILRVHSSLLKSNCRVTSQPDWGDVFIHIKGEHLPTKLSILNYIISFRDECHFHEEICETIYKRLWDRFEPEELSVVCLYVRRGGWDINPQRCSHEHLFEMNMFDPEIPWCKTGRQ